MSYEGKSAWFRVLFVALFWIVFYFTQLIVAAVTVAQCLFVLFTSKPNLHLMQLGDILSKYVAEILSFITFNTDRRPFPFTEFPKSDLVIE